MGSVSIEKNDSNKEAFSFLVSYEGWFHLKALAGTKFPVYLCLRRVKMKRDDAFSVLTNSFAPDPKHPYKSSCTFLICTGNCFVGFLVHTQEKNMVNQNYLMVYVS